MYKNKILPVIAGVLGLGVSVTPALAADGEKTDHWYAAVSGGYLISPDMDDSRVTLGQVPVLIEAAGRFELDADWAAALTAGRQFVKETDDPEKKDHYWRLEAELWLGRVQRRNFEAGVLSAFLDDTIQSRAYFINGLYRLSDWENSSLWLGAGIGHARVSMPGAQQSSFCSCLSEAEGSGTSYRVKLSYEYQFGPEHAVFADLGHVWLPAVDTDLQLQSFSRHGELSTSEFRIGYRLAF